MDTLLGVGIVGCGAVTLHRHAPEYAAHPQVALRGWVDGQAGRAQAMADRYGGVVYDSLEQLLGRPDIDAVSICVANAQHAAYACQALAAGKHVLCEKPMAMDSQEAAQMVKAAQAAGRNLFIGQNQRLAPAHRQAKELLDAGALGRIIRVTSTFAHAGPETWSVDGAGSWFFDPKRAGSGALADLGIHKLDLVRHLLGCKYKTAWAQLCTLDKRDAQGQPIGVDDNACCVLTTDGGALCTISASWTNYGQEDNSTLLEGEAGRLHIYHHPEHALVLERRDGSTQVWDAPALQTNGNQTHSGVIDCFVEDLLCGRPATISGADVLLTMQAVDACRRAAQLGKTVEV
jgi:predicted dehydrogenase